MIHNYYVKLFELRLHMIFVYVYVFSHVSNKHLLLYFNQNQNIYLIRICIVNVISLYSI